jgi:hypothetical protein
VVEQPIAEFVAWFTPSAAVRVRVRVREDAVLGVRR